VGHWATLSYLYLHNRARLWIVPSLEPLIWWGLTVCKVLWLDGSSSTVRAVPSHCNLFMCVRHNFRCISFMLAVRHHTFLKIGTCSYASERSRIIVQSFGFIRCRPLLNVSILKWVFFWKKNNVVLCEIYWENWNRMYIFVHSL
jgi:hypothetical protein